MAKRNEIHVQCVAILSPFKVDGKRPYTLGRGSFYVDCLRDYHDGEPQEHIRITFSYDGVKVDGASTFWPVSLLVPPWRDGDDLYNAAPTAHDMLYIRKGVIHDLGPDDGKCHMVRTTQLSREECDDILRGMWRVWGMSRRLAGAVDKAVEWFAGGNAHWGNDGYNVSDKFTITCEVLK